MRRGYPLRGSWQNSTSRPRSQRHPPVTGGQRGSERARNCSVSRLNVRGFHGSYIAPERGPAPYRCHAEWPCTSCTHVIFCRVLAAPSFGTFIREPYALLCGLVDQTDLHRANICNELSPPGGGELSFLFRIRPFVYKIRPFDTAQGHQSCQPTNMMQRLLAQPCSRSIPR